MRPLTEKQIDSLLAFLHNEKDYVFLDSVRCDRENSKSFLFLRPLKRIEFFAGDDLRAFVGEMEQMLEEGNYLAGWLSYEFGYLLEPQMKKLYRMDLQNSGILASFGVFSEPLLFDHETGKNSFPATEPMSCALQYRIDDLQLSQEKEAYLNALDKIKEYIAAGDTYQVNYTLKLLFAFSGSPLSFYRNLRRNQSVSFGAILNLGDEHILSLSPELFFRAEEDFVLVRPMKGTMKRGRSSEEDMMFCQRLMEDEKNRSENVMIVDLLRNDLARLTHQHDDRKVVTRSLFDVERYESVLQMTSTIYAETDRPLFKQATMLDVLKALFPCGSVTGAPKIRTMEILRELEDAPRGYIQGR